MTVFIVLKSVLLGSVDLFFQRHRCLLAVQTGNHVRLGIVVLAVRAGVGVGDSTESALGILPLGLPFLNSPDSCNDGGIGVVG